MALPDAIEMIREIEECFRIFDCDGNGSITLEEFSTVLEILGQPIPINELRKILAQLDIDGNGTIELHEFRMGLVNEVTQADTLVPLEEIKNAFNAIDQDRDGRISIEELMRVLHCLGGLKPSEKEILDMINQADTDRDGFISYSEFEHIMTGGKGQFVQF